MLLAHTAALTLDRPRPLKLALGLVRGRPADEALLLHPLPVSEPQTGSPAVTIIAALDRPGITRGPKGVLMAGKRSIEGRGRNLGENHADAAIRIGVGRIVVMPVGRVTRAHGISLCDRRQQDDGAGGKHQTMRDTRHQKTPLLSASETSGTTKEYHET